MLTNLGTWYSIQASLRDDVLVRRIKADIITFAPLVVVFGVLTPVAATVQVSATPGTVLVGNATLRAVGR